MSFLKSKFVIVGLVPIFLLAVAVGFISFIDPFGNWTFNPPNLTLILNAIFLTGTGIVVAAISAKSYIRQGNLNIVFLGTAVLLSGLASLAAGRVLTVQTANYSVTIHNIGFFVSSILQVISAALILIGTRNQVFTKRTFGIVVSYTVSVCFVVALTTLTLLGLTPTFFATGGSTLLRQAVVALTIIFFMSSCLILFRSYLKSKSMILYWYSLALGLFAIGFLSLTLQIQAGDGYSWVSKIAQYAGGLYFVLAVLSSRTKDVDTGFSEKWAEAFSSNPKQLTTFFSKMFNAFTYCKILTSNEGKPIDYVFLDVNDAAVNVIRLSKKDVLGKKASEIMKIDALEDWLAIVGPVAVTGEPVTLDRLSKFTGRWVHVSVYSPRKDYFVSISEDVTERKKAEVQTLRQNAILEGVNTIFQAALTVRSEQDLGQICLEVAEKVTGSKFGFIGDINPKGLSDIAISNPGWEGCETIDAGGHRRPPGNFALHGIYGRVLKDGKALFTNNPSAHPDSIGLPKGHPPLDAFLGVPLKREGKTIGMIAVGNREGGYSQSELEGLEALAPAIVEAFLRKRAENALQESEQRWATTLASIGDSVIATNTEGAITFMNSVAEELTGWTLSEASQKPLKQVFHIVNEETRLEVDSPVVKVLEKGLVVGLANHSILIRKDGAEVPIDDSGAPIKDENGKVTGIVLVFHDISERKLMEKKLEEYSKNLEKLVEVRTKQLKDAERLAAIGATAGMVGHDIRNPLQAITGDLYLAKTDLASIPESEEKQSIQESLTAIENNIDYINKIVADLQDYARPLNPKPEEADLKLIITNLFAKNNMPDNIELSVKVENSAEKISTDSHYINRIMFNLINNAVQAMPNGGKLTVHAFRGSKDIVMTVKDTGVGIPKEIRGKLFTPMFTTKAKGQGFGLPVVKRMTESLGGTVTFESVEGKGTTFTVRLPLSR